MPPTRTQRGHAAAGRQPLPAKRRPRRGDPLWARLSVVLGALLMMVSGGAMVGGKLVLNKLNNSVAHDDLLGGAAVGGGGGKTLSGALNVLLVGLDERPDNNEPTRSDSIIIMHVPATHDQAYLVSIPRDMAVTIPIVKGLTTSAEYTKINAAFSRGNEKSGRSGGMKVLAETLKRLAGISFNAAAIVNFGGFEKLVASLGGVDMCLDQAVDSHHIGRDKSGNLVALYNHPNATPVHYKAECRHLEAWEALDYVRQRYGLPNTDYDRARHQQQFIKAVAKRAKEKGLDNPVNALKIMGTAGDALTVDLNGNDLATWALTLQGTLQSEMVMLKVNAGTYNSVTLPDGSSGEQLSQESADMLAALKQDKLAEFVMQHPGVVTKDVNS